MTKTERGELLRARFRAMPGYSPPPRRPSKPKPIPYVPRPRRQCRPGLAVAQHIKELPCQWVWMPDPKPNHAPKPKRTEKVSPLLRIAARYPVRRP